MVNTVVTVATTTTLVLAAPKQTGQRSSLVIQNTGATNSVTITFGNSAAVYGSGLVLPPWAGATLAQDFDAALIDSAIQGIATGGTTTVSLIYNA